MEKKSACFDDVHGFHGFHELLLIVLDDFYAVDQNNLSSNQRLGRSWSSFFRGFDLYYLLY